MSVRNRPASFLVSALACYVPAHVFAAPAPPPNLAAKAETGSKDKAPLIVHNPDGTMTVQKEPAPGRKGLVIRPQVVVPTVRVPEKQKGN